MGIQMLSDKKRKRLPEKNTKKRDLEIFLPWKSEELSHMHLEDLSELEVGEDSITCPCEGTKRVTASVLNEMTRKLKNNNLFSLGLTLVQATL